MNRSEIMARVSSKNTTPEKCIKLIISKYGYKTIFNDKSLPGKPDIVFPFKKRIIFVNGCFWHQHKRCGKAIIPRNNREYWNNKLKNNIVRDKNNKARLRRLGWKVLEIWECESKDTTKLKNKLKIFLRPNQ